MLSNPAYQQALGAVNVTPDDLARVNEMLPTVVAHKETQARFHSEMRLMLQQRDLLLARSKRWFEVLMNTARVVLADQPGLLAPLYAGSVRSEAEKEATRKLIAERKAAKKKVGQ